MIITLIQRKKLLGVQLSAIFFQDQIDTFAQVLADWNTSLGGQILELFLLADKYIGGDLGLAFGQLSLLGNWEVQTFKYIALYYFNSVLSMFFLARLFLINGELQNIINLQSGLFINSVAVNGHN